jgi:hypothetical protein
MSGEYIITNYLRWMGIAVPAHRFLSDADIQYVLSVLRHDEEKENSARDEWGNWEYHLTSKTVGIPYLDNFILEKADAAKITRASVWPGNSPFAFCLTHDLDVISENDPVQLNRRYYRMLKASSGIKKISAAAYYIYTALRSRLKPVANDPLWHLEKWCDLEKSYGYSSTFYIYVADRDLHIYDCDLMLEDSVMFRKRRMKLSGLIRELHFEGFETGLHGSYLSFNDLTVFMHQKTMLESVIGEPVTTTRQHFLHYDIHKTPEIHKRSGIQTDSSLGFNRAVGFRAGTCYPYYIAEGVLEVPQILMDGALFNTNSHAYNESQAIDKIKTVIDAVEYSGGCLVVNYHPNYLNREAWWNSYRFLLQELKRRNACCMSMENIYKLAKQLCVE